METAEDVEYRGHLPFLPAPRFATKLTPAFFFPPSAVSTIKSAIIYRKEVKRGIGVTVFEEGGGGSFDSAPLPTTCRGRRAGRDLKFKI